MYEQKEEKKSPKKPLENGRALREIGMFWFKKNIFVPLLGILMYA
jgi:hypothetical protein